MFLLKLVTILETLQQVGQMKDGVVYVGGLAYARQSDSVCTPLLTCVVRQNEVIQYTQKFS